MTAAAHAGHAAARGHVVEQAGGTLDIAQHTGSLLPRQQIPCEQGQQFISHEQAAPLIHDREPVAVAVESQPEVCAGFPHGGPQGRQVLLPYGVGRMMGKTTVRFAEQLFDFRAQTTQNQRADLPRRSVSPVQHDPEGTAASQGGGQCPQYRTA